jgi:hypothetical protein
VAPQLSSGWQYYYSTNTRQAGHANEQSMYSLMSMETAQGSQGKYSGETTLGDETKMEQILLCFIAQGGCAFLLT